MFETAIKIQMESLGTLETERHVVAMYVRESFQTVPVEVGVTEALLEAIETLEGAFLTTGVSSFDLTNFDQETSVVCEVSFEKLKKK